MMYEYNFKNESFSHYSDENEVLCITIIRTVKLYFKIYLIFRLYNIMKCLKLLMKIVTVGETIINQLHFYQQLVYTGQTKE